jgi:lipopolysaccharide biosynthesis regulator YciM
MKYKVEISEGCTSFYTSINDKLDDELSMEEVDEFVDYLCEKFKQKLRDSTVVLNDLIRCFQPDNWESDKHSCDQCGDSVHRTYWEF